MKDAISRTNIAFIIAGLMLTLTGVSAQKQLTLEQLQAALPELERFTIEALQQTSVPGAAVAVVSRDEVVYMQGFGVRKAGGCEPVTADTVFQLASMSKPLASSVIAALVGDGVVAWDDRISALDPEFRLSNPWITSEVTRRDLFSHQSGLYDEAGNHLEDLGFTRGDILQRLLPLAQSGSFRASYEYSNFGMTAGGVAAASAAGRSWAELSEERLYQPFGMTSTSSRYEDFVGEGNRAHLHILVNGA